MLKKLLTSRVGDHTSCC